MSHLLHTTIDTEDTTESVSAPIVLRENHNRFSPVHTAYVQNMTQIVAAVVHTAYIQNMHNDQRWRESVSEHLFLQVFDVLPIKSHHICKAYTNKAPWPHHHVETLFVFEKLRAASILRSTINMNMQLISKTFGPRTRARPFFLLCLFA